MFKALNPAAFGVGLRSMTVAVLLHGASFASAQGLPPPLQKHIRQATFEVVRAKPTADSLSYEKELPLHLLPYKERTDSYWSIGTAFRVGANQYLSAAHVVVGTPGSALAAPALRDSRGNVHAIDRVLGYSAHEDYVLFSLETDVPGAVLEANPAPEIDEPVYAVGNALGEGVVIRDGLYTSDTPETLEARWNWIRFSAAASPGNSGGPLLDKSGRVIGIVMRKSPNENLNYALPIYRALQGSRSAGSIDIRMPYSFAPLDVLETFTVKQSVPLPSAYGEFDRFLVQLWNEELARIRREYRDKHASSLFPVGSGSEQLLQTTMAATFPHLIGRGKNGIWDIYTPQESKSEQLGANGYIVYGNIGQLMVAELKKPDSVDPAAFYGESKTFMDLIVKAVPLTRAVGQDPVRITSLGSAREEHLWSDRYGRKWQARVWLMEYSDTAIVSAALAVPDGYAILAQYSPPGMVQSALAHLQEMTDFVYVSYSGKLSAWHNLQQRSELLPAAFATTRIHWQPGGAFSYESPRMAVTLDTQVQNVSADSILSLQYCFFNDDEKTVWDAAGLTLVQDLAGTSSIEVARTSRPPDSLPETYHVAWRRIVQRSYPFDGAAVFDNGYTSVSDVVAGASAGRGAHPPFIYSVSLFSQGETPRRKLLAKMKRLKSGVRILEQLPSHRAADGGAAALSPD